MKQEAIRFAYGEALAKLGDEMPDLMVLDADVSNSTWTKLFAQRHPDRFLNMGISESNMVCVAAGMASAGLIPVVNTFGFLLCEHSLDQIRASVAYPGMNVKLAGHYGGLSDSYDGASHHTITDLSVMRAIPNMKVVVLSDAAQTRSALKTILMEDGPVYFRLCRAATAVFHQENEPFHIGKAIRHSEGADVMILTTGIVTWHALLAAERLAAKGISAGVMEIPTLKPLDEQAIVEAAAKTKIIFTLEESNVIGGLGSAVTETVCMHHPIRVIRLGIQDAYTASGSYEGILAANGISVDAIVEQIERRVQQTK